MKKESKEVMMCAFYFVLWLIVAAVAVVGVIETGKTRCLLLMILPALISIGGEVDEE